VALAIGERMCAMIDRGEADACLPSLLALSEMTDFDKHHLLLVDIAQAVEAHGTEGSHQVAAQALALAWCQARGGGGYLSFGGLAHSELLVRATHLDADEAQRSVARGIAQIAGGPVYRAFGVTQALVDVLATGALAGGPDGKPPVPVAFEAWDEAFAVVADRLPNVGNDGAQLKYRPGTQVPATMDDVDQSMALAAFAGLAHPSRENKRRTLLALRNLAVLRPDLFAWALPQVLSSMTNVLGLTWLLVETRDVAEPAPELLEPSREALKDLAATPYLAVRSLARGLLDLIHEPRPDDDDAAAGGSEADVWNELRPIDGEPPKDVRLAVATLAGVAQHRLELAEDVAPGITESTTEATARILGEESFTERVREAVRALKSHHSPWPDAILPLTSVPEHALQTVAGAARAVLAFRGQTVADPVAWERDLAEVLLPTPLPLLVEQTRTPRPATDPPPGFKSPVWAPPTQDPVGGADATAEAMHLGEATTLHPHDLHFDDRATIGCAGEHVWTPDSDVDPESAQPYAQWAVLGHLEVRRLEPSSEADDGELVVLGAGVELDLTAPGPDHVAPPLSPAFPVEQWFEPLGMPIPDNPQQAIALVCRADLTGQFSDDVEGQGLPTRTLLVPSPGLVDALDLRPTGSLALADEQGPAVALVSWRAAYEFSDYHMPYPKLRGSRLLLRPDLAQRLVHEFGARLTMRRHVLVPAAQRP
jgi:hypothetical protein